MSRRDDYEVRRTVKRALAEERRKAQYEEKRAERRYGRNARTRDLSNLHAGIASTLEEKLAYQQGRSNGIMIGVLLGIPGSIVASFLYDKLKELL